MSPRLSSLAISPLLALCILGSRAGADAQVAGASPPQVVEGILVDAEGGEPVPQAVVRLWDGEGELVASTLSDPAGAFRLAVPRPGTYRLEVQRVGYVTEAEEISVDPGQTVRVELRLSPAAVLMDPLIVTGERAVRPPRCVQQLIVGRVADHQTGEGLSGASVDLLGADDTLLETAHADAHGRFTLVTPGPGLYRLRGQSDSYVTASGGELATLPGDTIAVEFSLSAAAALESPMVVTGSARPWSDRDAVSHRQAFFDRMKGCQEPIPQGTRFGQLVDRSVIAGYEEDGWPVERMLEREVPEVWTTTPEGGLTFFGECSPTVIVDGAWFNLPGPFEHFRPDMLEAVEVYRTPHVPREYWDLGTRPGEQPCGIVALWTRGRPEQRDPSRGSRRGLWGTVVVLGLLYLLL